MTRCAAVHKRLELELVSSLRALIMMLLTDQAVFPPQISARAACGRDRDQGRRCCPSLAQHAGFSSATESHRASSEHALVVQLMVHVADVSFVCVQREVPIFGFLDGFYVVSTIVARWTLHLV